jgi:hypothetical protein
MLEYSDWYKVLSGEASSDESDRHTQVRVSSSRILELKPRAVYPKHHRRQIRCATNSQQNVKSIALDPTGSDKFI